jgi:hypothetical protein
MIQIQLPTKTVKAVSCNPRKMLIAANPKSGKTSLCSALPNSLLIDLEDSAFFFDNMSVSVKAIAKENGITMLDAYRSVIGELEKQKRANNNNPVYDYIVLDTTTALTEIANEHACITYKASPQGKAWTGNSISSLPNGMGYGFLRDSFFRLYSPLSNYCSTCLILLAHLKAGSMNKNGEDVQITDVNLIGSIKTITAGEMDANAILYRNKGSNQNMLSFLSHERNAFVGARSKHLENQEFLISELKDGKLETYWDKIFIKE